MKHWQTVLIVVLLIHPAAAVFNITNPQMYFHTSGGAVFNLTNTSVDAIQWGGDYLNLTVNGSMASFNGTANVRLGNITHYNNRFNFTGEASAGTMGVVARMNTSNAPYKLNVDSVQSQNRLASATGDVYYEHSTWSFHTFEVLQDVALPVLTMVSPAAYTIVASSASTLFTTSTNQPVNYFWTVDGSSVTGAGTYSSAWTKGLHYIKVYGSNANGNSNTLEWRVTVNRLLAVAPVPTANESRYDLLKNDTRNANAQAFVEHSILPYTDVLSDAFWLFIWLMIFVAYWIRQRQATFPAVIALIFGGVIISTLPEQYKLFTQVLVAVGVLGVLYFLFVKKAD